MNETQKHLLKLLQEVDDLCAAHNLRYFLAGGCFIGAFRHRGFLPWDDDADILMTIDDVTRLKELEAEGKLPPNRTVINMEDFGSGLLWRYSDTTTTAFWRSTYPNKNHPHGQYIDIFVMYPGPDSDEEREQFLHDYRLARNLETIYVVFQDMPREEIRELKRKWNPINKHLSRSHRPVHSRKILCSNRWKDSGTYFISTQNKPEFEPRAYYEHPMRVQFEDTTLCVYEGAKGVLSQVFGSNWLEIPTSPNLRKPAHDIIGDMGFPYPTIIKDIAALDNFALARFLDRGVKTASIKHWGSRADMLRPMAEHEVVLRAKQFNALWEAAGIDLDEMERTQDFADAEFALRLYYEAIGWPRFTYWGLSIPVNDDVLWAAWYPQLQKGNYLLPLKILRKVKSDWDDPLLEASPRLRKLYADCVDADTFMDAYWSLEDYDLARPIAFAHADDSHSSIVFTRALLAMLGHDATTTEDFETLLERSYAACDLNPGDGELAYWQGFALLRLRRPREATPCLLHAQDCAVNGLIRLMAGDLLKSIEEEPTHD